MSGADRTLWQAARSLSDLGRLTAAWLEGAIQSHPGYQPRHGPDDDETLPYVQVLATANRGGYLTTANRPGLFHTDADGTEWAQRDAVEGVISDHVVLRRLIDTAETAGLEIILNDLQDAQDGYGPGAVVTLRDGEPHTVFGRALGIRDLDVMWHGVPQALDIVAGALQVTLADPAFGPSSRLQASLRVRVRPAASVAPSSPSGAGPGRKRRGSPRPARCLTCVHVLCGGVRR